MAIYDIDGNEITSGSGGTSASELQRKFSGKKSFGLEILYTPTPILTA